MFSWEYNKFYSRVIDEFTGSESIKARLAVAKALSNLPGTSSEILRKAWKYSKDYNKLGEKYPNTTLDNIKRGTGGSDYFVVIYFWLHRAKHHQILTDAIDQIVFGKPINYQEYFGIKPSAPFSWPSYVLKNNAKKAAKELAEGGDTAIWLNPFNHHSIPLEGRNDEWAKLDDFIEDDADFYVAYIIAPSGAGKTRLISQWMRKLVADPNDTEGFEGERPPAKAGGFELRLKAGSVRPPADYTTLKSSSGS